MYEMIHLSSYWWTTRKWKTIYDWRERIKFTEWRLLFI